MMDGGIDMTDDTSSPLIVVGVDGPVGSREALQWAVAQAELSGAAVQAVMAWRLPEAYAVVLRDYEADARHELQTAIEETLGPDQRSRVTSLVTPGGPAMSSWTRPATPGCSSSAVMVTENSSENLLTRSARTACTTPNAR